MQNQTQDPVFSSLPVCLIRLIPAQVEDLVMSCNIQTIESSPRDSPLRSLCIHAVRLGITSLRGQREEGWGGGGAYLRNATVGSLIIHTYKMSELGTLFPAQVTMALVTSLIKGLRTAAVHLTRTTLETKTRP